MRRYLLGALLLALLGGVFESTAIAQTRSVDPIPMGGSWCGVTADGGSVMLVVSDDTRFVESIDLTDPRGGTTSSGEGCVLNRAQIKNKQFIFKCNDGAGSRQTKPGGPGRCTKAPCRGDNPGNGANDPTAIRGTFLSSEAVRGNYTAITYRTVRSVNGARTQSRRIVGNYIAWPVSSAPCP
jgi:hypothetical protein